mmetsp:Transcript_70520/g.110355  ORF Transcript_70520/g.110355 Transcript_70520/m.110355 type:complete len:277 (+) Transcript_70520:639-1469(+)
MKKTALERLTKQTIRPAGRNKLKKSLSSPSFLKLSETLLWRLKVLKQLVGMIKITQKQPNWSATATIKHHCSKILKGCLDKSHRSRCRAAAIFACSSNSRCDLRDSCNTAEFSVATLSISMSANMQTLPFAMVIPKSTIGLAFWSVSSKRHAPARTVGKIRKITGKVATIIGSVSNLKMPTKTNVIQSGPPQRIAIFVAENPGVFKAISTALVGTVCTPTRRCTHVDLASQPPMTFCCIALATSFIAKPISDATTTPDQKPFSSFMRATMTIPADM